MILLDFSENFSEKRWYIKIFIKFLSIIYVDLIMS